MIEKALIVALVALVIVTGAQRVAGDLNSTFCKINHAFDPRAVCVEGVHHG